MGLFSTKSDVFSFGIMLLEVISGRSRFLSYENPSRDLFEHAWRLWKEDNLSGIVDEFSVVETGDLSELLRYIHIGLLCIQQQPEKRPSMAFVTFMLESSFELLRLDYPISCFAIIPSKEILLLAMLDRVRQIYNDQHHNKAINK
ncbi:hypothetical protein V6N13_132225 [Hibiscus sabdariffa]